MTEKKSPAELIVDSLSTKAALKLRVTEQTEIAFGYFRKASDQIASELNPKLVKIDKRIQIKSTIRGPFDAELKFSDDILIFSMHTDVFTFDDSHQVRKSSYLNSDPMRGYCGMIMVYNFITDSFTYQRQNDLGYLVARVFVNHEGHFFVEGKRQLGFLYNDFEAQEVSPANIRSIVESAMLYSIHFDIYVPPFDQMKVISVQNALEKSMSGMISTGKRLGFKFQSDNDLIE